jgi:glycosyltransferase involved in cell wall biosynthesis
MQNNPLFSILVANYNNGHFFKNGYQSILNQTYSNWEVIIVDDASTDDSISIIQQLIGQDNRFQIYSNDINRGCGYTKNKCTLLAKGEILGFLDPDDALKENALELMVNLHLEAPDVAIITSRYELVDLEMNFIKEGTHGSAIPENKSYLTYGMVALTHFATFKQNKYRLTTGIDPIMNRAVDQDLYFKMEEQGKHLFLDKALYLYRIHENSISNNQNSLKARYWHIYAIRKAYERRKKMQSIDNISKKKIAEYLSDYYLSKFEALKNSDKYKAKYHFIFKAIVVYPSHRFIFKAKSLVLLIIGRI